MDKIKKYRSIASQIITELGNRKKRINTDPSIKYQNIIDDKSGNYILLRDGWVGTKRYYCNLVHIEVPEDGLVWLHEDRTDLIIADKLLNAGIPQMDIVLGFQAPIVRPDTEFAVG